VPVLAEVSDSADVVRIVKTMPGYMDGYNLEPQKYDIPSEPSASSTASSTGYSIISSESYTLTFRPGFAVLEDETVKQLDIMVMLMIENPGKKMLLSVYNVNMKDVLYKNRINAIKTYMKVEGISLDRIQLNYLDGAAGLDEFKVNYIE
jgi:hypothetical protein